MKILEKLFISLAAIIVILGIIAFFLPSRWETARSVKIKAKPAQIYKHIADLKLWPAWSPWTKEEDPSLNYVYSGSPSGKGAIQDWTSQDMGTGSLEITKANPQEGIYYTLKFKETDMEAFGSILFESAGSETQVTWQDHGELGNNPVNRYFGLVLGPLVGKEFEVGLAKLKAVLENTGHE